MSTQSKQSILRSITVNNTEVPQIKNMNVTYASSYNIKLREYLSNKLNISEQSLLPSSNKYIVTSPLVVTTRGVNKFVKLFHKDVNDALINNIPLIIVLSHDWKGPTDTVKQFVHNKDKFEIAIQDYETLIQQVRHHAIENNDKMFKVNLNTLDILKFEVSEDIDSVLEEIETVPNKMSSLDIDELINLGNTMQLKHKDVSKDKNINEDIINIPEVDNAEESSEYNKKDKHKSYDKLTKIQYACIKLRVPESGYDWLDEIIKKSNK